MIKKIIIVLFLTSFISGQEIHFDLSKHSIRGITLWKFAVGDDPDWAAPDFNDSLWFQYDSEKPAEESDEIRWYRSVLNFSGDLNMYDHLEIHFNQIGAAFQLFWDGELIGENGKIGNSKENEEPGLLNVSVKLKHDQCYAGTHVLAVRLSGLNFRAHERIPTVYIGYSSVISQRMNKAFYSILFDAGIFILASIFCFALFLGGGRHRAYLLFGVYSLLNVIFPLLVFYTNNFNINIAYLTYINFFGRLIAPLAVIFLNIFFIVNYNVSNKKIHIALNMLIAPLLYFTLGGEAISFMPLYSAGILILAIRKKEAGSIIALTGLLIYLILIILHFYDIVFYGFIAGDIFFVFCITFSISRQVNMENKMLEESRLLSARLEVELLKKNIQPHFLMNTLLSIMSWIEENPVKSMDLIQALADEFRMINSISSRKEIPLSQELELCDIHLQLMGHRKDASYQLIRENLPASGTIPPMVFHTLVENGLTHAFDAGEDGVFKLSYHESDNEIHYCLENNGSLLKELSEENIKNNITEGMGLKYVKARLEERYGNRWQLRYGLTDQTWRVDIILNKAGK